MPAHVRVQATDGTDFYRQIAVFAYGSYLEDGFGAVVISQGEFRTHGDGRVEAVLAYVPYADDDDLFPPEAESLVQDYDPKRECVLAVVDSRRRATCLTLTADQLGPDTPEALFKEAVVKKTYSKFLPGCVLKLRAPIDDLEPGWFVFIGESGNEFVIARAGEDEDGDIVATDEQSTVHVDYAGEFDDTGISVIPEED